MPTYAGYSRPALPPQRLQPEAGAAPGPPRPGDVRDVAFFPTSASVPRGGGVRGGGFSGLTFMPMPRAQVPSRSRPAASSSQPAGGAGEAWGDAASPAGSRGTHSRKGAWTDGGAGAPTPPAQLGRAPAPSEERELLHRELQSSLLETLATGPLRGRVSSGSRARRSLSGSESRQSASSEPATQSVGLNGFAWAHTATDGALPVNSAAAGSGRRAVAAMRTSTTGSTSAQQGQRGSANTYTNARPVTDGRGTALDRGLQPRLKSAPRAAQPARPPPARANSGRAGNPGRAGSALARRSNDSATLQQRAPSELSSLHGLAQAGAPSYAYPQATASQPLADDPDLAARLEAALSELGSLRGQSESAAYGSLELAAAAQAGEAAELRGMAAGARAQVGAQAVRFAQSAGVTGMPAGGCSYRLGSAPGTPSEPPARGVTQHTDAFDLWIAPKAAADSGELPRTAELQRPVADSPPLPAPDTAPSSSAASAAATGSWGGGGGGGEGGGESAEELRARLAMAEEVMRKLYRRTAQLEEKLQARDRSPPPTAPSNPISSLARTAGGPMPPATAAARLAVAANARRSSSRPTRSLRRGARATTSGGDGEGGGSESGSGLEEGGSSDEGKSDDEAGGNGAAAEGAVADEGVEDAEARRRRRRSGRRRGQAAAALDEHALFLLEQHERKAAEAEGALATMGAHVLQLEATLLRSQAVGDELTVGDELAQAALIGK
ncbi:hypothetical protein T492DRAFT_1139778 [Pavlovales sp. CCMP2436]|nr:hypothetical protein T492DRAFT_1139778 [Pavlovales sp. CCMP2436]